MKTLKVVVWGYEYVVTFETNSKGLFESGYAKGAGKIDKDSMTAQAINKTLNGE